MFCDICDIEFYDREACPQCGRKVFAFGPDPMSHGSEGDMTEPDAEEPPPPSEPPPPPALPGAAVPYSHEARVLRRSLSGRFRPCQGKPILRTADVDAFTASGTTSAGKAMSGSFSPSLRGGHQRGHLLIPLPKSADNVEAMRLNKAFFNRPPADVWSATRASPDMKSSNNSPHMRCASHWKDRKAHTGITR